MQVLNHVTPKPCFQARPPSAQQWQQECVLSKQEGFGGQLLEMCLCRLRGFLFALHFTVEMLVRGQGSA